MSAHQHRHQHRVDLSSAPDDVRHCLRCGAAMATRVVGERPRRVCPACGYVHFPDPKVGVGAMVVRDGRLLLVRRAVDPERGRWALPAGFLDAGEDPRAATAREVLEETGLEVAVGALVDAYADPGAAARGGATVFLLYRAEPLDDAVEPVAADDVDRARFVAGDEVPDLAFDSTRDAVRRWRSDAVRRRRSDPPG